MTKHAALALLLLGCYAAPPPPAMPGELSGCHPGAYAALSDHACRTDGDCELCASEDAPCGEVRRRGDPGGAACAPPAGEECGGARRACCEGRCVRSLGPPPL